VEQPYDYFLVFDLEGKEEIIEFPVALLDAKTLEVVDRFHRYCVPVTFSEDRLKIYITTKYGKWGLADKWFASAISFVDTISQFQEWMASHKLLPAASSATEEGHSKGGETFTFAFVTCGNWDIKTQIPRQCRCSGIPVPDYFHQWVNLKDVYLNFYAHRALGMAEMLNGLSIKMQGHHHSGSDDVENITAILVRIINDGAKVEITASRPDENSPITYKYTSRI
jgi:inhibitor of KinA sporulation pathway (predicted exonuclease)